MKKKTKKILFALAEIGTVVWVIRKMFEVTTMTGEDFKELPNLDFFRMTISTGVNYPLVIVLVYFLSAVLILYFLRQWANRVL